MENLGPVSCWLVKNSRTQNLFDISSNLWNQEFSQLVEKPTLTTYVQIYIYSWSNIDIAYFLTSLAASDRLGLRLLVVEGPTWWLWWLADSVVKDNLQEPTMILKQTNVTSCRVSGKSYPLLAVCTVYSLLWLMDALGYTYRHPSLLGDDWWHPSEFRHDLSLQLAQSDSDFPFLGSPRVCPGIWGNLTVKCLHSQSKIYTLYLLKWY